MLEGSRKQCKTASPWKKSGVSEEKFTQTILVLDAEILQMIMHRLRPYLNEYFQTMSSLM
jgi:hypothetical protein